LKEAERVENLDGFIVIALSLPFCAEDVFSARVDLVGIIAVAQMSFTLSFEAFMLTLAKATPIANAAKLLGEHDTRLMAHRRTLRSAGGGEA